jgi:hypothetical protein
MATDNPILDMGLLNMWQPNQYLNPAYAGKPLSLPGFYTGSAGDQPPTDALGRPIRSFVNSNNQQQSDYQTQLASFNANQTPPAGTTTLNATSQQPTGGGLPQAQQSALGQWGPALSELTANYQASPAGQAMANNPNAALIDYIQGQNQNMQAYPQGGSNGFGSGNSGPLSASQRDMMTNNALQIQQLQNQAPTAAPASSQAPTPPDLRQTYLDALANPGKVTTPGATVAPSNPLGQPSVLNAFLDTHPSGGTGSNAGFFNTLNKLRGTA